MTSVQMILREKAVRVLGIEADATVLAAAQRMCEHKIGALVVTRKDRVVGIFTERDLLCRVVAAGTNPADLTVESVMSVPVAVCAPDTTRDECRAVMRERRLRHLPVVDDSRLVGMISIGDLIESNEAEQARTIEYLHEYLYGQWM